MDLARIFDLEPFGARPFADLTVYERTSAAWALQIAYPYAHFTRDVALAQFKLYVKARLYNENRSGKRKVSEDTVPQVDDFVDEAGQASAPAEELVEVDVLPEPSSIARPTRVRVAPAKSKDYYNPEDLDL